MRRRRSDARSSRASDVVEFRVALTTSFSRFRFQRVQQIVRFHALAFSSRHLNVRPLPIFFRELDAELFGAGRASARPLRS